MYEMEQRKREVILIINATLITHAKYCSLTLPFPQLLSTTVQYNNNNHNTGTSETGLALSLCFFIYYYSFSFQESLLSLVTRLHGSRHVAQLVIAQ